MLIDLFLKKKQTFNIFIFFSDSFFSTNVQNRNLQVTTKSHETFNLFKQFNSSKELKIHFKLALKSEH